MSVLAVNQSVTNKLVKVPNKLIS